MVKYVVDEITGLPWSEIGLEKHVPMHMVTDDNGTAYSIHHSDAAAKAWIKWNQHKHPKAKLGVEEQI